VPPNGIGNRPQIGESALHEIHVHPDSGGSMVSPAQPNPRDLSPSQLGLKLRLARMTKGLTLKDLAGKSGCSESLLSKVENGKALPSLPLLHRIVQVLESNIGWLFDDSPVESTLVWRAGQRPMIVLDPLRQGEGITLERIVPYGEGHLLQGNIHHIEVGGESDGPISHEGEELGYVLIGRVQLTVDDRSYDLAAGDSFNFRSHLPHAYKNIGDCKASIVWINTPPTF
jgi:transcriptional regulator with XRE-family HTH domain